MCLVFATTSESTTFPCTNVASRSRYSNAELQSNAVLAAKEATALAMQRQYLRAMSIPHFYRQAFQPASRAEPVQGRFGPQNRWLYIAAVFVNPQKRHVTGERWVGSSAAGWPWEGQLKLWPADPKIKRRVYSSLGVMSDADAGQLQRAKQVESRRIGESSKAVPAYSWRPRVVASSPVNSTTNRDLGHCTLWKQTGQAWTASQ